MFWYGTKQVALSPEELPATVSFDCTLEICYLRLQKNLAGLENIYVLFPFLDFYRQGFETPKML